MPPHTGQSLHVVPVGMEGPAQQLRPSPGHRGSQPRHSERTSIPFEPWIKVCIPTVP